jgi:integrator complex subunit 11
MFDHCVFRSTYATTVRDSKRARERDFLKAVHTCVAAGGKVLIPVFALGRAQELCILLDEYWERTNLKVPIYFSAGLTMQANVYYKLLISWTNQKVKDTYVTRNTFDFKHGIQKKPILLPHCDRTISSCAVDVAV